MMTKKPNYYRQIIQTLGRLKKAHPTYNMGRHISTALGDYDLWGVTDKEILDALKKYEIELNMDFFHTEEEELRKIIDNGIHLERMFDEEDEEY